MSDQVQAETRLPAAQLVTQPRVLVIAHRGASAHYPENTLPAFAAAGELGSDLVELDYYHSRDGIPVVFHDRTLDRTTDANASLNLVKAEVHALELGALKSLDAGSWFDPRFEGTRIPTLEEALAVIQQRSMTLIERKDGDAKSCVEMLHRLALSQRVVVQAFDWEYLAACHEQDPTLVLGALGSDELTPEKIEQAKATGAAVIGWNAKHLTADGIRMAHNSGLRVWAYTVNDPERAKQLVEDGINGLITDDPAAMRPIVAVSTQGD